MLLAGGVRFRASKRETRSLKGRAPALGIGEGSDVRRRAIFSTRLEQRRKTHRLAVLVAATLLAVGIGLIAFGAMRGFDMLEVTDADRTPIVLGVLIALAGLVVLCLIAYATIRAYGRVTSR